MRGGCPQKSNAPMYIVPVVNGIAMRDRKVILYTETGVKCEMSIETFRTIGGNGK